MDFLANFKRIGWDVDDTLIGSRRADDIADYIRNNPLHQQHYVITFRSHGMQDRVFHDLKANGLDETHFVSMSNCPDAIYEGQGKAYWEWKGAVCAELGIEVLVDDDTENVAAGCSKHGIAHVHPDHLSINPEFVTRVSRSAQPHLLPRYRDTKGEWHDVCDACGFEFEAGVLRIVAGKVVEVTCASCRAMMLANNADCPVGPL